MSGELHNGEGLQVDGVTVRFGGIVALDDVSLRAPVGRITGLIGPNGAGKTTLFNACSGLNNPQAGHVHLFGQDLTHASAAARAQHGLGRTFQRMELFDSLSVRDNVSLGREAGLAGSRPWRHIYARRRDQKIVAEAAERAMVLCGIEKLAATRPGDLSTGQRRLVELARVVSGGFRLLLLDEPSSGLDVNETVVFGQVLRSLVEGGQLGLLVVEHDMALVMSICDYVYVLDFGHMIFEGTASEVAASEIVRAAYLGGEVDLELAEGVTV